VREDERGRADPLRADIERSWSASPPSGRRLHPLALVQVGGDYQAPSRVGAAGAAGRRARRMSTASFRLRRPPRCVHLVIEHLDDGRSMRVVTSPSSRCSATSRSSRRMILPSSSWESGVSGSARLGDGRCDRHLLAAGPPQVRPPRRGHRSHLHGDERHNGLGRRRVRGPTTAALGHARVPPERVLDLVVEIRVAPRCSDVATRASSHKSPSRLFARPRRSSSGEAATSSPGALRIAPDARIIPGPRGQ